MARLVKAPEGAVGYQFSLEGIPGKTLEANRQTCNLPGVKRREGRVKHQPLHFPDQASAERFCNRRSIALELPV